MSESWLVFLFANKCTLFGKARTERNDARYVCKCHVLFSCEMCGWNLMRNEMNGNDHTYIWICLSDGLKRIKHNNMFYTFCKHLLSWTVPPLHRNADNLYTDGGGMMSALCLKRNSYKDNGKGANGECGARGNG